MNFEIAILQKKDMDGLARVLSDWLRPEEVGYYIASIEDSIFGLEKLPRFDSHYYVAIFDSQVIAVAGFRQANPKLLQFAQSKKPAELCMLYVKKEYRAGNGIGTALLNRVTAEAKKRNYQELIVRSAEKFKDTGWGFYDKIGFTKVGRLDDNSAKVSQIWSKSIISQMTSHQKIC